MCRSNLFLMSLTALLSVASFASAEEDPEADKAKRSFSISTAPDEDIEPWTEQKFWEVSGRFDFGYAAVGPDRLDGGSKFGLLATSNFGWSYGDGDGSFGPLVQVGGLFVSGTDSSTGQDVGTTAFLFAPGAFNGNYLGDAWVMHESLSLPITSGGIGIQADWGFTFIFNKMMSLDFGLQAAFLQTPLKVNNKEVNLFTVGPFVSLTFQPWGRYE